MIFEVNELHFMFYYQVGFYLMDQMIMKYVQKLKK